MLGLADRTRVIDLFEALMRADIARALAGAARPVRHRRRSRHGARRSRRVHPFRHPGESRAGGGRRRFAHRSRAHARPRLRGQTVDARSGAHLADAAQGHRRGRGGRPPDRRRRNGAGPHRLRRRSADARRGHPLARRQRARQRRAAAAPSAPTSRADMPARSEMPRGGGTRGPLASAAPLQDPVARGAEDDCAGARAQHASRI